MTDITGALEQRLLALSDALPSACGNAAALAARTVADKARQNCPESSGRLRESIVSRPDGVVAATAPYAAAVELGTYRRAAAPFLAPALHAAGPDISRAAADAVRSALEEDA